MLFVTERRRSRRPLTAIRAERAPASVAIEIESCAVLTRRSEVRSEQRSE
jgi:hypothetical protein